MADAVTATKKKYMNFKEIAAYSLGLFGFQAIVGLLNSYQAEFDGSILGANVSVVAILILVAKIVSAVADPRPGTNTAPWVRRSASDPHPPPAPWNSYKSAPPQWQCQG